MKAGGSPENPLRSPSLSGRGSAVFRGGPVSITPLILANFRFGLNAFDILKPVADTATDLECPEKPCFFHAFQGFYAFLPAVG
jgi:hypothetical protein